MIRFPYRWLPRTFWRNISFGWSDLTQGVSNVWRWVPFIWYDRDWDYVYLLQIMEFKLRRMSKCLENGNTVLAPREARRCLVAAVLCKRLKDDNYYKDADKRFSGRRRTDWALHIRAVEKQDQEMLGKLISKYITHWWD